jgi:CheY-like chemotaxis protein
MQTNQSKSRADGRDSELADAFERLLSDFERCAGVLLRGLPDDDPLRLQAVEIVRHCEAGAKLVRESRRQAGAPQAETEYAAPPPVPEPAGGTETILVVEDSETVRGLICAILSQAGYTVLAAGDPTEALATCDRCGPSIDLVLTDVMMPVMTGIELVNRLSITFPTMKVIYVSGFTGETVVDEGLLDERGAFLQKPFSPDSLLATVRGVLDGSWAAGS